jgi:hypothetical protein
VGLSSVEGDDLAAIQSKLAAARSKEETSYTEFGVLAETRAAVQAAVLWNLVYSPLEYGPFAPVIRGNPWGLNGRDGHKPVNDDW